MKPVPQTVFTLDCEAMSWSYVKEGVPTEDSVEHKKEMMSNALTSYVS